MGKTLAYALFFMLSWGIFFSGSVARADECDDLENMMMRVNPEDVSGVIECRLQKQREAEEKNRRDEEARNRATENNNNLNECLKAATSRAEACKQSFDKGQNTCDTTKLKGAKLTKEDLEKIDGVSEVGTQGGKVLGGAKDAYTQFAEKCTPVQQQCVNDCTQAREAFSQCMNLPTDSSSAIEGVGEIYNQVTTQITTCQGYSKKITDAKNAAKAAAIAERDAEALDKATDGSTGSGTATAAADGTQKKSGAGSGMSMPDLSSLMNNQSQPTPTPTPITPTASQGCDNPANNDRVCLCLRNPAMCQAGAASLSPEGLSSAASYNDGGSAAASSFDPGIGSGLSGLGEMNPSNGSGQDVGGKQGAGAAVSGESAFSGAPSGNRGGGAPPVDYSTKIHGGFYGSTSSGGKSFGGASGSGSSYSAPVARAAEKPDLTKFLPGGKLDPNRGPSSLVGKDGITGPNDFNWDKMHRQFQRLWREGDNFLSY